MTCAIPGTGKPEHMIDNLAAGRGALPDAAMRRRDVGVFRLAVMSRCPYRCFFALALAGPAAFPVSAADAPARDGVDVRKSSLLLLPKSTVENSAGQQYAQMMRSAAQQGALNVDRRQVERLREIARKLIPLAARFNADAQRWRWEVNLINAKTVNAFCMPGGKIAFYAGILGALKLTDDEVAMIMGHEIAHALLEHGRARMSEQVLKNVGVGIAAALLNLGQMSTSHAGAGRRSRRLAAVFAPARDRRRPGRHGTRRPGRV